MRTPRPKVKRAVELSGIKTTVTSHYLDESNLNETFPKSWHQLEVIRGESPKRLLDQSILTPSLAASVFTAKYVNAVFSEGVGYDGINISRQGEH